MLAASLFAIAGIRHLSFDSSLESLTAPGDPARAYHAEIQRIFGDQEIGVVAIVTDDAFQPEVLDTMRDLSKQIGAIAGVDRVLSLATAKDVAADVLNPPSLMPPGKSTAASAKKLRERVAANPIYLPHLVARDYAAIAINVFFAHGRSGEDEARIDSTILELVAGYEGPGTVYYAGMSHIRVRSTEMMKADLARFLPLSLLCMMGVLWISFRSFRATLLPLLSIATGVATLLGLMGWLGEPITLTTLVLPSLLLVIGGSYSVHVTAAVLAEGDEQDGGGIKAVIGRVGLPVGISALTTAVGFGALAIHPVPAIAGLGKFAVVGIAVMAFGCLFGLGMFFLATPERSVARPSGDGDEAAELTWLDRLLEGIADFAFVHRRLVFVTALVLVGVAVAGATRVAVDTNLLTAFRAGAPVRVAYRAITEALAGPNPVSIVVTGPEPGYFKALAPLRRVKDFQDFLASLDEIDSSLSVVDYMDQIDAGLRAGGGGDLMLDPETGELVEAEPPASFWDDPSQLEVIFDLMNTSPDTFRGVVDPEYRRLRITGRTAVSGSRGAGELTRQIESYAAAIFPRGVDVTLTGNLIVVSTVADKVLSGQIQSVVLAFSVIFCVLALQFLSLRVGVAAMIPNVLPVLIFFGVMGWSGVELNLATSIIAAVALGIAVDDTIHYMAVLNRTVKTVPTQRQALRLTMRRVGRPVVATSITLTAGFLVMLVSRFGLISTFGWLSAMTMMVALVTNLVVLPAVLATVPVISVWDLVAFRLGPRPNQDIPLFAGLGRLSTRLVVLLGRIRSFSTEQAIVRSGEEGHEMYLVLTGQAEVRTGEGSLLATLGRGDVFGEMALLRQAERVADVIARDDVEVLVIDEDFLRRLRILYPRFASRFFLNIARILSDRLEEANLRAAEARKKLAGTS